MSTSRQLDRSSSESTNFVATSPLLEEIMKKGWMEYRVNIKRAYWFGVIQKKNIGVDIFHRTFFSSRYNARVFLLVEIEIEISIFSCKIAI